jgi:predicted unusual protein kinase regulating ubiquinone biosynthesis (AarF/ABC1/UbiB family)
MADITSGRARRMLSVGRLTTSVGSSYLWQAIKRPFQSASRTEQSLLGAHIRNAERIVAGSRELRGAFTKLVQMLSMRTDMLPGEALQVLSVVQSQVPAMPYARVQEVVREELGAPPEERFRHFEPEAFAAASLGQVHRAQLRSGESVAVKVQYPGVATTVRQDVRNLKALLRVVTGIARDLMRQDVDATELGAELETRLHEELDYLNEAANLERFATLLADDHEVMIPRVHRRLTTRRVLTMSYLEGYPIQDIMAPGVDQELKDWVAVKLFRLLWRQVCEFGALHADPHPGNYLVTHHPRLGILDFGSVRLFEPEVRRGYLALARALLARDDAALVAACLTLGYVGEDDDPAAFARMMHIMCEPLERDAPFDPRDFDLMARGAEVAQIAVAHRLFRRPPHSLYLLRSLLGVDGYLKTFGTVRNWHRLFRELIEAIPEGG